MTVVEPGYLRSEFLAGNSAVYASKMIDDHDATSGATRRSTKAVDGRQANDPKKL